MARSAPVPPTTASRPPLIGTRTQRLPYTPTLTPQTLIGQSLWTLDRTDGHAPYQNNVNMGIQRQLPGQMVLTVSYVGNTGVHLPSRLMPTYSDASPIPAAGRQHD